MKAEINKNLVMSVVFIIASEVLLSGCGAKGISGVEIVTQPVTKIYIDGKEAGMTPYRNNSLQEGLVDIRLGEEGLGWWERKIKLKKNISTVINWTFDKTEKSSGGYILSMERLNSKNAGFILASLPSGAAVSIDGEIKGDTPMAIFELGEGDKEVKIMIPGFKTISIGIRPIAGYRILIEAFLAKEEKGVSIPETTSSQLTQNGATKKIKILATETGWLRIREGSSSVSPEIGRVKVGEEYEYSDEKGGFLEINFNGKKGWISSKYAVKL
jgi:hypothetical protein